MSLSMQDLLSDVYAEENANALIAQKQGKRLARVTDGLKPKPVARKEGLAVLEPEQLLNIQVDPVALNGRITGYQRELTPLHARKVAHALRDGQPVPVVELALDGKGRLYAVDGQHRIAGAIMARVPLRVVITRMDKDTQARLFHSQRRAKPVDPNVLVLAGKGPFEAYIRQAIEDNSHPWSQIVSASRKSKTRISPWQMYQLLTRYVGDRLGQAAGIKVGLERHWDQGKADEFAPLIACFGNRQTNPPAFSARNLSAIGTTATLVLRRHEHGDPDDLARWITHQSKFPFDHYLFIRTERDMTDAMLVHWNKRLRGKRRVVRAA